MQHSLLIGAIAFSMDEQFVLKRYRINSIVSSSLKV